MSKKPIIGLSCDYVFDSSGRYPGYKKLIVNKDYCDSIRLAGGIPVIIPMSHDRELLKEELKILDGLVMIGGADIDPTYYGEEHLPLNGAAKLDRDIYDMIIYEASRELKLPVFGICRGFQVINVFEGGTLYQDLEYFKKDHLMHAQHQNPEGKVHKVFLEGESWLKEVLKKDEIWVNSFHHQAVKDIAKSLKITGRSSDTLIESFEKKGEHFVVGVQWHPEKMAARENRQMLGIFEAFINKLKKEN